MRRLLKWLWTRGWRRRITIAGGLFILATPISVEVTSQSWFCNSCHIMGTYYTSWQNGTHRNIECVECHIAPGATNFVAAKLNGLGQVVDDVLDRASTKPSASVSDFSCTRSGCHVIGQLGPVEKPTRPYRFDHDKHLTLHDQGISVHCTTCHSHVKGEKHFEVNTNVCVACHLMPRENREPQPQFALNQPGEVAILNAAFVTPPQEPARSGGPAHAAPGGPAKVAPSNCDACHKPPDHPITYQGLTIEHSEFLRFGATCNSCHRNATEKPKPVESAQCYDCHDFGMERFTKVDEMHTVHTEGKHKVECLSCHGWIRHGPEAQILSLEQFDCQSCHRGQHMVQRSAYSSGTLAHQAAAATEQGAVSPMFLVHVDCTGCHVKPSQVSAKPTSGATVNKATAAACDNCHRPGLGEQMVPMWQRATHELYDGVAALMPTKDNDWSSTVPEAAANVEQARQLLELVRVDGSWGVHNPKYTQRLIEQAREKVVEARKLAQPQANANQADNTSAKSNADP